MDKSITFFDTEIDPGTRKILDIGAIKSDGSRFHKGSLKEFAGFLSGSGFVCGHNIIAHDMKYVGAAIDSAQISRSHVIDTLYLSPLIFPKKPYHSLLKNDKLQTEELNNPLNDSEKAKELFDSECAGFGALDDDLKEIYWLLLGNTQEFRGFFNFTGYNPSKNAGVPSFIKGLQNIFRSDASSECAEKIRKRFRNEVCTNADIGRMVRESPVALAYSLALIGTLDQNPSVKSVTPPWVLHNYPEVEQLIFLLRNNPCKEGCQFCDSSLVRIRFFP